MGQTTVLCLCELVGLTATIEKHSEMIVKRRNAPITNVAGDGKNHPEDIHDPVQIVENITLELNPAENAVFLKEAHKMFDQQMLDPTIAQPIVLYSYLPNSRVVDTTSAIRAVIQEIHTPPGDTNAHNLATAKIICKPLARAAAS